MWKTKRSRVKRLKQFFFISLSHESLSDFYQSNFNMMQHHGYSLNELEDMMPWEREIYITLLRNYIKEENDKQALRTRTR